MSETGGRPSKRVRTNDGSTDSEPSFDDITRDEEFWLDDGNVVLVAGNRAFKIYRGLLAIQSPVFSDMFATASPNVGQLYDGCPVIRLSDSKEDLRHLLRALIPKEGTSLGAALADEESTCTFDQLSSLTRLGHKYQIGFVEHQAITQLKLCFAVKYEKWSVADNPFAIVDGQGIEAVHLARLTDNHDMLPFALYSCSVLGGAVIRGWTREDGTAEHLDANDLERCIDGYASFREETPGILARIFRVNCQPKCASALSCRVSITQFYDKALAFSRRHAHLDTWFTLFEEWIEEGVLRPCSECWDALNNREDNERRALWRRLPEIYGLPTPDGWEA